MANEVANQDKFYGDALTYWESISPTIDGMLGGFEKISPTDINGSKAFLRSFLKVGKGTTNANHAIDCGSGIGRITKRLLLPMFHTVDMVELNQKFLDATPAFVGESFSRVGKQFCCGLQNFMPEVGHYDVMWCQWVLGHLTDEDFVEFFQRCKRGLAPEGIIVIKENVTATEECEFDSDDSSFTRPKHIIVDLIAKSGLTIVKEQKQKGFPKGIYKVYMFALQ